MRGCAIAFVSGYGSKRPAISGTAGTGGKDTAFLLFHQFHIFASIGILYRKYVNTFFQFLL